MADKKQIPIQLDAETKAALDKHLKVSGSKSYKAAIANLLGIDTPQPKAKKPRGIYKEHTGVPASIVDAAILLCWTLEKNGTTYSIRGFRDKTRAEIVSSVRDRLEISFDPRHTTWMSLYPKWYKESLEDYINDRLQSLKRRGFIVNTSKGIWSMSLTTLSTDETQFLLYMFVYIEPSKQLNIPQLLKDRK